MNFKRQIRNLATLVFILIFVTSAVSAAEGDEVKQVKPEKGDWGMVLNLSGLIDQVKLSNFTDSIGNNTLLFKHYRNEKTVYRFGLGLNINNKKTTTEDSLKIDQKLISRDSVYKQSSYSFSIGIEKHLGNSKRLDPYIGLQAVLGLIGKTKIEVDTKESGSTGTRTLNRDYVLDGGSMFSLQFIGGFNYFIADRFSLGAEYLFGFTTIKRGGNYSDVTVDTPPTGSSTSQVDKGELTFRETNFTPSGSALITLSYFF